jgi:RNA polymerase sigma-70 factor (sigma-E family)
MGLSRLSRRQERNEGFAEYYASRGAVMRNTAYLLCGDWHLAEDLTQTAFTKLYLAWRRVDRHEALDQYLRRTLVRAFLDEKRRPWRREYATEPGGTFDDPVLDPGPEDRLVLLAALGAVPPRQRATLVLRFWADLPVEQVAEILGCSLGTVKSQTARGLQALRDVLDRAQPATTGESKEGTDD